MNNETARLWQAYRASFRRFASQSAMASSSNHARLNQTVNDDVLFITHYRGVDGADKERNLENAREAYLEARNRLASALLTPRGKTAVA